MGKLSRVLDTYHEAQRSLEQGVRYGWKEDSDNRKFWEEILAKKKESTEQRLTELVRDYIDDLEEIEFTILKHQIGGERSYDVNRALRGIESDPRLPEEMRLEEYVERLDEIIKGSPRLPMELEVFRGQADPLISGEPSLDYLSTSMKRDIAKGFPDSDYLEDLWDEMPIEEKLAMDDAEMEEWGKRHLLELTLPEGSPALFVPDLREWVGKVTGESELLLPRGSRFEEGKYRPPYKARGGLVQALGAN